MIIDFTSAPDQSSFIRCLAYNEPGIDGYAVPSDSRTRLQDIHPGMTIGQTNELPDIDIQLVADNRQLIRERNIDITEAIFRQLAHFSGASIGDNAFAFHEDFVKPLCRL